MTKNIRKKKIKIKSKINQKLDKINIYKHKLLNAIVLYILSKNKIFKTTSKKNNVKLIINIYTSLFILLYLLAFINEMLFLIFF